MQFLRDLLEYIGERKKYWLLPLIIILLIIAIFILFANSPVAPFIYTLF